jgi:hypothetical protein
LAAHPAGATSLDDRELAALSRRTTNQNSRDLASENRSHGTTSGFASRGARPAPYARRAPRLNGTRRHCRLGRR